MGVRPLASKMFASIGVRIDWHDRDSCPFEVGAIQVHMSYDPPGIRKFKTLAFAQPYDRNIIVVFPNRVQELNRNGGPSVLAHVLVHEITHVLEGISRHSATGIMKAQWDDKDYFEMRRKPLRFAQEDVALIYDGLKARQARVATAVSVLAAPDTVLGENLHSVTLILHFLPNLKGPAVERLYWRLWDRAFGIAQQAAAGEPVVDSVEAALNIPIGRLTDELFDWAGKRAGDGDAEPFWIRLEKACVAGSLGRAARALAAIRTAWLFGSRPEWTRAKLLCYFDWKLPDEAKLVWKGFTFGATFSPSLWSALRKDFIASFDNLGELDVEAVRVFHQLIGRIAIHEPAWLTDDEAQRIVTCAPHVGREQIAWVFWTSLDAAGKKAGSLWRDRIGPWLTTCWQPDEALKAPDTSMNLIRVALAAGDAIPEAVDAVLMRMSPLSHADAVIFLVKQSKAPEEFPEAAFRLLDKGIDRSQSFYKGDLEQLLRRIEGSWAKARDDSRFRNLSEFAGG